MLSKTGQVFLKRYVRIIIFYVNNKKHNFHIKKVFKSI
jgi:hypothetical protein